MSSSEYVWSDVRERAIRLFGHQAPGAELEAEVVAVFEEMPALVAGTIDAVATEYAAGRVHSPWAVLRSRLRDPGPVRDVTATDESELERAIERAENRLHNIGAHLDSEREVLRELFEAPGERCGPLLGRWAGDAELEARMLSCWRDVRGAAA